MRVLYLIPYLGLFFLILELVTPCLVGFARKPEDKTAICGSPNSNNRDTQPWFEELVFDRN